MYLCVCIAPLCIIIIIVTVTMSKPSAHVQFLALGTWLVAWAMEMGNTHARAPLIDRMGLEPRYADRINVLATSHRLAA